MVLGGELFWNCTNFSPTGLTFYQGGGGGGELGNTCHCTMLL